MKYSFIIAMYNAEKYIEECIQSIQKQKGDNYEILIIDDGSKDNSYLKISKYLDDVKVRCIRQENQGCGAARNTAIKNAKGEYIIIVDADDTVEPNLLENLEKSNADIIKYNVVCVEENPNNRFDLSYFENLDGIGAMVEFCKTGNIWATPWGSAIKKSLYVENDLYFEGSKYHEDFGLMPQLYAKAKSVSSINYLGYKYIKRPNSMTTTTNEIAELKRARDFMFHFTINIKILFENEDISKEDKNIIYEYYITRFLIKISNSSFTTQNAILGELNYELPTTSNKHSKRK